MKRLFLLSVLVLAILFAAGCRNKKVQNPIADLGSKQPDKVLFDRAMEAMQRKKYDVARLTLQTLINTYPDSEYVARAKLAVGDSWYAEGGSAGLAQAEIEYKDFITFFPNMPEAAEAQLKVANIHYRQMEKPDRDYTHAKRAEDEYKQLILQFPDSQLVPEAKARLLEVQEVLAEREFRIGRFYFLRGSINAAIARLQTLVDTYPLYSQASEALFLLGQAYESRMNLAKEARGAEAVKERMASEFADQAADAYSRIITRYPVTERVEEAKLRLQALARPVPTPTAEAIAQNKAEEDSRKELGRFGKIMGGFRRRPDTSLAAKVGEPTLVEPKQTSAPEIAKAAMEMATRASQGEHQVGVETVKPGSGEIPASEPIPGSQQDELPTEAAPAPEETSAPPPAPTQVNEAATEAESQPAQPAAQSAQSGSDSAQSGSDKDKDDKDSYSTSKKKKKKGLRKLIPF